MCIPWTRLRVGATGLFCLLLTFVTVDAAAVDQPATATSLRVCADPDNLPLSNQRGEGYENKIAEALASDLGRRVEYTFFPQRMGFVRNTLRLRDEATKEYKCDVIIGVPKGYDQTATTRPYMHSTYALLIADPAKHASIHTAADLLKLPRDQLSALRIGVFGRSPGTDWLLRNGMIDQAVVYAPQSGDVHENPASIVEHDLNDRKIDVAILWGPMAGYLVQRHTASSQAAPEWRAVPFLPDPQIRFDYEIAMGVRFGEKQWQSELDNWIDTNQGRITKILLSFRVPLLDASGNVMK
ncbi:quinoprotein dehydrogenase-associated putative ABC transporter substrate-binding protein [Steroidobacter cummioxidans]|uniref:quinoprotein dehydrogenase-associated putative ABC transporter substrate-binding protein n=1 Tax=Steroidobacter cummioxidans TaxID=1803913 RepID=UPI000E314A19|nr:quinoprotein dehydrogenase-associated putative ABC transporter substrate-binding protein [Steroidobacter cummioxidans]